MNLPPDPKPGTREALKAGCTCPVMDNAHGKGRYGDGVKYGWWIVEGCPLHATESNEPKHTQHCVQCGWSGTDDDYHACPGLPGENEW